MDCIFCKIVAGGIPSFKVYEDDYALAFLDINPIAKGHTLVMPKIHVKKISELEAEDLSGLMAALQKVTRAIEDSIGPEGLNIFVNQGEAAGQIVPHLHIHIVPRAKDDGLKVPTAKVEMTEEGFKEISKKIADAIKV